MSTSNNGRNSDETSIDETSSSFTKQEFQRKELLLLKEVEKNKQLSEELSRYQNLYEREKRQNQQYARDMEVELNKRDEELEKREHEIFEMIENRQRLQSKIGVLENELTDEKNRNQMLTKQLNEYQQQLQDERNKTMINPVINETALIDAEAKVEDLKVTLEKLKTDVSQLLAANCELSDRNQKLDENLANAESEIEMLHSLNKCQNEELKNGKQLIQELEIQLHALQTADGKEIAPRGNSMFAEVIDGKERLEGELALLHQQNRKLRTELNRALRLAYENSLKRENAINGELLTGPTLTIYKLIRSQLENWMSEKQMLLEKLHALEEAERRGVLKMASDNSVDFNIFQENINSMTMYAKQRAENRALQLELREIEFLKAIAFEKQRAAAVPQMEHRIKQLERLVEYYEHKELM